MAKADSSYGTFRTRLASTWYKLKHGKVVLPRYLMSENVQGGCIVPDLTLGRNHCFYWGNAIPI